MNRCKCGVELTPETAYAKGNRLQSKCKSCFNLYCMDRWTQIKKDTVEQFGGVCKDCGNSFPHFVFDFHHLDPSKKTAQWTKLRLMSEAKRNSELEGCVILCANCHRIRHHG